MVWAGVKPWLSERTTDKIKILTSSEVNEELAKHIDLANKDVGEVHTSAKKITSRFTKIEQVELEEPSSDLVDPTD